MLRGGALESALKLLATGVVRRVANTLTPLAIPVMPLKGALWQATLYEAHEERSLADVDVVVPSNQFELAEAALLRSGFAYTAEPATHREDFASSDEPLSLRDWGRQLVAGYPRERELRAPELPLYLDLHRSLFARGRYALTTRGLFARARRDQALFGAPVWVPHPLDQLAHLLGHLATDHRPGEAMYRSDLERLVVRERIAPEAAAKHLERHGLARAARFALLELGTPAIQAWVAHCVTSMQPDPLGDALVVAARDIVHRTGRFSSWSALMGHALNTDPRQIVAALSWAAVSRVRARSL